MHNEERPRILFQSVPDDLVGAFAGVPGTHSFVGAGAKVHVSDHDLLVCFGTPTTVDTTWHVLGFGLDFVYLDYTHSIKRDSPDNYARDAYVAANDVAQSLRSLIQRTLIDTIPATPRATWSHIKRSGGMAYSHSASGDLDGAVLPLVHLGQEQYVYAHIAPRGDNRLTWALPNETTGHREWLLSVLDVLHRVDPERFPGEPDWKNGAAWATPGLARAVAVRDDRVAERDRLAAQAALDIAAAATQVEAERASASAGAWRLLTEQGDELVHAVRDALNAIGFDAVEYDETHKDERGRLLEDLRVADREDEQWEALVEVKGYTKGARANDVTQVLIAPTNYFVRENGREPHAVWHVVNVFKDTDPSLREAVRLTDIDLHPLTTANGALIDTRDLFRAWRDVEAGAVAARDVRASLRAARTRWSWPPPGPSSN